MKKIFLHKAVLLLGIFLYSSSHLLAQSPGTIVKPINGNGVTILNPNGDKFSSKTSAGFSTNDITESEIPFKVVPPVISEAEADNRTGPTGGFTDIVSAVDGSGFYAYFDGTNLLYRLRLGGTNNGAKAYSVLLDTDMKFGNTGQYADPNYIAPGVNTPNGNPGFEYEIVFSSQFDVTVYNVDGKTTGTKIVSYPLNTHSQISVALSKDGGDADYFYDWGVPLTTIGSPSLVRFVISTQISPHPAVSGKVSDIFGIDDRTIEAVSDAWTTIINAQCGFSTSDLSGTAPFCKTCTNTPTINPVATGNNIAITGNWQSLHPTKPNTATITLYRNGTQVGTTTATSGMGWSITLPVVYSNDVFTAKAKATDESECLFSPPVQSACTTPPAAPVITCAGVKGIEGLVPTGADVIIYEIVGASRTLLNAGLLYTTNPSDRKFDYHGTVGQSGAACQGNANDVNNGSYAFYSLLNGCYSQPTFICITGPNTYSSLASNSITLSTPILTTHTSVTGTGATSGQTISLYRNGELVATQTAAASSFTFSNLTLFNNDVLKVYAQNSGGGQCMTTSGAFTVTCFTTPPKINANAQGEVLSSATAISGTTVDVGSTIKLYKGNPPAGTLVGTTTANAAKAWTIGGLTLIPGDTYYATSSLQCESGASRIVVVKGPTNVCPTITGTYNEKSTTASGTLPSAFTGKIRLYLDGAAIDSVNVTNATTWSIATNTTNFNRFYAYGWLSATAEGTNLAESAFCNTIQIQCVSPAVPTVTPLATTINKGQSATFTVSNAVDTLLYSIWDAFGNNYASSVFGSGTGTLVIPSYAFSTTGTYNLMVISDKLTGSGCYSSRAVTVTVQNVALAVKFLGLSARRSGTQVKLDWQVTNEENVKAYHVQRSEDGLLYTEIASVPYRASVDPSNQYSAVDQFSVTGTVYYRIQQVDNNGRVTYSPVASVNGENGNALRVAPNPAKGHTRIYIESNDVQEATAVLLDFSGKQLIEKKFRVFAGGNVINLEGLEQFPAGHYILRVGTKDSQQHIKLLLQ